MNMSRRTLPRLARSFPTLTRLRRILFWVLQVTLDIVMRIRLCSLLDRPINDLFIRYPCGTAKGDSYTYEKIRTFCCFSMEVKLFGAGAGPATRPQMWNIVGYSRFVAIPCPKMFIKCQSWVSYLKISQNSCLVSHFVVFLKRFWKNLTKKRRK